MEKGCDPWGSGAALWWLVVAIALQLEGGKLVGFGFGGVLSFR